MSDWFDIRQQARRDIHAAFAVEVTYTDSVITDPVTLHVRWHEGRFGVPIGSIPGGNYAQVLESVDRIVFNADELTDNGVVLRRGGEVYLTKYDYTFVLDVPEPNTGPVTKVWTVSN